MLRALISPPSRNNTSDFANERHRLTRFSHHAGGGKGEGKGEEDDDSASKMTSSLRARACVCVRAMTMNPQRRREKKESRERDERATPTKKNKKKVASFLQKKMFRVSSKEKWKRLKTTPPLHSQKASDISSISRTHASSSSSSS